MITVGSRVRIREGANNYYGTYLQEGAYDKTYTAINIQGDKVILCTVCSITGNLDISCVVNMVDLRKEDIENDKKK